LGRLHMDDWYGFNAARGIPDKGALDPEDNPFLGFPREKIADNAIGPDELDTRDGSRAVPEAAIQDGALAERHFPVRSGNRGIPGNVKAFNDNIAVDAVQGPQIKAREIGGAHIKFHATDNAERAIETDHIKDQAITAAKITDNLRNPPQGVYGLRTIGSLLGGDSTQAAAGNHSHGSGNTHDFDYLPDTHQARILLARQRVRANIRNLDTLTAAQFRLYIRELAIVSLCALALEIDAPDLTAEERRQKRQAGEALPEFFEWRRSAELEASDESAPLHTHDLPRYVEGQTDVGEVPE
jgi:hypothetical protein